MKLDKASFSPLFGEWWSRFQPLFDNTTVMEDIYMVLKEKFREGKVICPGSKDVFKSFQSVPPDKLKCIFVLLDPYPSVKIIDKKPIKVANGIAMDCSNTGKLQPSLEKFYEAIEKSEYKEEFSLQMFRPPSLEYLTEQGVMFFNTALTVEKEKTGSHTELWAPFMKYFYEEVMAKFNGMIYVLCGKDSQKMKRWITPLGNYIMEIEHPSYAARQYRDWNYDDVFKKVNFILKNNNNEKCKIVWDLSEPPF